MAVFGGAYLVNKTVQKPIQEPKPQGKFESEFLYQEVFYDCSKPIAGEWEEAQVGSLGGPGYYFVPASENELDEFCRVSAVF